MPEPERRAFGSRLREVVVAHHSLDHLMDGLLTVLERVAGTRAA